MLCFEHLESMIKQQADHAQIGVPEVTYLYIQISKHFWGLPCVLLKGF